MVFCILRYICWFRVKSLLKRLLLSTTFCLNARENNKVIRIYIFFIENKWIFGVANHQSFKFFTGRTTTEKDGYLFLHQFPTFARFSFLNKTFFQGTVYKKRPVSSALNQFYGGLFQFLFPILCYLQVYPADFPERAWNIMLFLSKNFSNHPLLVLEVFNLL